MEIVWLCWVLQSWFGGGIDEFWCDKVDGSLTCTM